jgi:prepilin-type processing-associated H-X9-DG protein
VTSTGRPLFADVNASLPNPEARDPRDPEHEAEMRKGFSVVQAVGMDVFAGVGPSLRRAGDTSTSRFDFRHSGVVNVIFLDGHLELVKADKEARLERIHRYWNSLDPEAAAGVTPR